MGARKNGSSIDFQAFFSLNGAEGLRPIGAEECCWGLGEESRLQMRVRYISVPPANLTESRKIANERKPGVNRGESPSHLAMVEVISINK
jgi:hypothetical protein